MTKNTSTRKDVNSKEWSSKKYKILSASNASKFNQPHNIVEMKSVKPSSGNSLASNACFTRITLQKRMTFSTV